MSNVSLQTSIDRIRMTADFHQREVDRQMDEVLARTEARINKQILRSRDDFYVQRWARIVDDHNIQSGRQLILAMIAVLMGQTLQKFLKPETPDEP